MSMWTLSQWRLLLLLTLAFLLIGATRLLAHPAGTPSAEHIVVVEKPCPPSESAQGLGGSPARNPSDTGTDAAVLQVSADGDEGATASLEADARDEDEVLTHTEAKGPQLDQPTGELADSAGGLHSEAGLQAGVGLQSGAVDINTATAEMLQSLPGIGPVLAQRIIAYREQWGPFHHLIDLLEVSGIGPRTLERLQGHIVVGEP